MSTESEIKQRDEAILDALTGLDVRVTMGQIFGDSAAKPLTREGAQLILDRLRSRGFKIERV
jgi:hypothetical protein